jgi:chemotaxis protein CheX
MEARMKAEYVNPFIQSVEELFKNMLDCEVRMGEPTVDCEDKRSKDIIGVIGLSGTAQGIVALRFPISTALNTISQMVGTRFRSIDSSIIDGVGELINIVAGNGKSKFDGHTISLSLPTVVRGSIYNLHNTSNTVFLTVPFESDLGNFSMLVTFKPVIIPEKEAVNAGLGS